MPPNNTVFTPAFLAERPVQFGGQQIISLEARNFPSSSFTLTCWLQAQGDGTAVFYGNWEDGALFNDVNTYCSLSLNGGTIAVRFANFAEVIANAPTLRDGRVHHLAFSFDQDDATKLAKINIYLDAGLIFSDHALSMGGASLAANNTLYIGSPPPPRDSSIESIAFYPGRISDLRIWAYQMQEEDIVREASMNNVSGLEDGLYLAIPLVSEVFDPAGQVFYDLAPSKQHAQLRYLDTPPAGMGYIGGFDQFPVKSRTVEFWLRCSFMESSGIIISYGDYSNSHDHLNDTINPWYIANPSNITVNDRSSGVNAADGRWHHIAIVFDADTKLETIYLDGNQASQWVVLTEDLVPAQVFVLGAKTTEDESNAFRGQMKRVAIWSGALTQSQLKERIISPDIDPNTPDLISYWPLALQTKEVGKGISPGFSSLYYLPDWSRAGQGKSAALNYEKITSRSVLTQDFHDDLTPYTVYRSSITVSPKTHWVDIWTDGPADILINDKSYRVQQDRPARIQPSILSKISVAVPAKDLICPTLKVRSNAMYPEQLHYVFLDVEAHKKVANLPDNAIATDRKTLGVPVKYSDDDLSQFQTAVQNICRIIQYTYNNKSHGVHHDRFVKAANMQDPHFVLHTSATGIQYQKLDADGVRAHNNVPNASIQVRSQSERGFLDDIGDFFGDALKIVVHTAEAVGGDILDTAENIGNDIGDTLDKLGEDIVNGDFSQFASDLLSGGENVGSDFLHGAGQVIGDLGSGAGQVIVLTVHTAEKIVQFVLNHTGIVGEIINALFTKIGVAMQPVMDWLAEKLDMGTVLKGHRFIHNLANEKLDSLAQYMDTLQQKGDNLLDKLDQQVMDKLNQALAAYEAPGQKNQPASPDQHSFAMETVEWLLGKFVHKLPELSPVITAPGSLSDMHSPLMGFVDLLEAQIGKDGAKLMEPLRGMLDDIKAIFTESDHQLDHFIHFFLELAKLSVQLAFDIVKVIFDALMQLGKALIEGFKTIINAPLPFSIPFISAYYARNNNNEELTLLKLMSLIVAIPATIIGKAASPDGQSPFPDINAVQTRALAPLGEQWKGYLYGSCHLVLAPLSVVSDMINAVNTFDNNMGNALNPGFQMPPAAPNNASVNAREVSFRVVTLLLNVLGQVTASPIVITETYDFPDNATAQDPLTAPDFWSHVIWVIQNIGLGINGLAAVGSTIMEAKQVPQTRLDTLNSIMGYFNFGYGLLHMSFMAALDVSDRNKIVALSNKILAGEGMGWDPITKNYYQWAVGEFEWTQSNLHEKALAVQTDQIAFPNVQTKGFTNIADTLPEVGQLGAVTLVAEGSDGFSLLATAFLDLFGHLGEGITVMVRASKHELV